MVIAINSAISNKKSQKTPFIVVLLTKRMGPPLDEKKATEELEQKISEHFLVPKHEIVPKDKEHIVLENFGAKKSQIPKIVKDDPIVEEIGAESGELIKITRKSHTAGKTIYFRVVSE